MCLKCERLKAEHAPPEAFPSHAYSAETGAKVAELRRKDRTGLPAQNTLYTQAQRAQRAAERTEKRRARRVKIPQMWASAAVRLARFCQIWKLLKLSREDYARKLGMSYGYLSYFIFERPNSLASYVGNPSLFMKTLVWSFLS